MNLLEQVKRFHVDCWAAGRAVLLGNDGIVIAYTRGLNPHLFIKDYPQLFLYHVDIKREDKWVSCPCSLNKGLHYGTNWHWSVLPNAPQIIASLIEERNLTELLFSEYEEIRKVTKIILEAKQSLKLS